MISSTASHRSVVLLLLVATATGGLSYSRGNVNEVGLTCFSLILAGLLFVLFVRGPWQQYSDTRGGVSLWQIALPCAWFYVFAVNAGRYLLSDLTEDWQQPLQTLSVVAAVLAAPSLLLAVGRIRQQLSQRGQELLLMLPLIPVVLFYLLVPLASPLPAIDVFVFLMQSARGLLAGVNPYEITFTNIYESGALYPSGLPDSFPYPPMSLAFALAGELVGDVRWSLIACHVAAAGMILWTARCRDLVMTEAIMLGGMFLFLPYGPFVTEQAWTDPTVAMALALLSLMLARRRPTAALWAAGLAVASKQTMAILLPLLWALWRRVHRGMVLPVLGVSAVTYGIFALWNLDELFKDVVWFHLHTPFRARALTWSAYANYLTDTPLPAWLGLIALVTGVIVGVFGLRRASKDADPCNSGRVWRLYAGIAFAYLLTAMFSKHAFMNYYYLVYFALVVALVWSRIADRESDSLEPE